MKHHLKFFFLTLIFNICVFGETSYSNVVIQRMQTSTHSLFNEQGLPTQPLLNVLALVGMEETQNIPSLLTINDWTQKNLLRRGERWDNQTECFESLAPQLTPYFRELGFAQAREPSFQTYKGALIHGALLARVRHRLYHLVKEWEQGIRFEHVYLLSGERPLEPSKENKETLLSDKDTLLKIRKDWTPPETLPNTEAAMMLFVWEQADIPEEMRSQVKVHLVSAPMIQHPITHQLIRPTTKETVQEWLKQNPPHGPYLAISNAPYTLRQHLVMQKLLPEEYEIDTIGTPLSPREKMVIILDELARVIFEISELPLY